MATAYVFSSSVSWGRSWGLLPNISSILGQTCICWEALRQWIGGDQSHNAVGTFFHVFVSTVSPPFCLFSQTFSPISELIDLARWVKFCIKSKYRLGRMGSRFRPDDIWDLEWFDWTNELTNVTSTSSPGQFAPYPSEQRKLGTECKQATSHPKNRRRLGTRLKLLMIGLWYSNQSYVTPHVHLNDSKNRGA